MITPEQIPYEAELAFGEAWSRGASVRHCIAAALNSWPDAKWHTVQVPDDSDEVRYMLKKVGLTLPLYRRSPAHD